MVDGAFSLCDGLYTGTALNNNNVPLDQSTFQTPTNLVWLILVIFHLSEAPLISVLW